MNKAHIYFFAMYTNEFLLYENKRNKELHLRSALINNHLIIANRFNICKILYCLKYNYLLKINMFVDLLTIDLYETLERFPIIINLISPTYKYRILMRYIVNEAWPYVPSITPIFPMASWYERESWEMFGIVFDGNKELSHLCLDYAMTGFPMRKDFPLSGYTELEYSNITRSIIFKPVTLIQEYRVFRFELAWKD
jgi:NADH-quinone oxidoreductase subunit C